MRTDLPKLPLKVVPVIDHDKAGRLVREARRDAGISLRRLAKAMGFSAPFICDLERGRRNWTDETFKLAMKILNKPSQWLLPK